MFFDRLRPFLKKLARLPGGAIPREALSGDSVLDDYLTELDRHLLGSGKIRLISLAEAKDHLASSLWPALGPGVAISLTILGFNLLGDGLRDALDPRLAGSE